MKTMGRSAWAIAMLCLVVAFAGACKKKGPGPEDADFAAGGKAGEIGEGGLGGSSLDRARRGLGPEEDGVLKDVRFGYDTYDLDDVGRSALDANVDWLRANGRARIELEGHTDSRGTIEYNLALGSRRAKSVKDYLLAQGVAPDRVSSISYGEELSVCQEETESCWARNRRVHFVVLGQ